LNRCPPPYHGDALPTELKWHQTYQNSILYYTIFGKHNLLQ